MAGLCNLPDPLVVETRQRRAEGRFRRREAWHYTLCRACDAPWTAECGGKSLNLIVRLAEPRERWLQGGKTGKTWRLRLGWSSAQFETPEGKKNCFVPKYLTGKVSFLRSGSTIQRLQVWITWFWVKQKHDIQLITLLRCVLVDSSFLLTTDRVDKANSMGRKWTRMIGCANLYPRFILGSLVFQGWECWDRILQCPQMLLRRASRCLDLLYTPGSN